MLVYVQCCFALKGVTGRCAHSRKTHPSTILGNSWVLDLCRRWLRQCQGSFSFLADSLGCLVCCCRLASARDGQGLHSPCRCRRAAAIPAVAAALEQSFRRFSSKCTHSQCMCRLQIGTYLSRLHTARVLATASGNQERFKHQAWQQ